MIKSFNDLNAIFIQGFHLMVFISCALLGSHYADIITDAGSGIKVRKGP